MKMTNFRVMRGLSSLSCAQLLVYLALISAAHQFVAAQQKWQHGNQQQIVGLLSDNRGQKELDQSKSTGEKVDRFSSATGDTYWSRQPEQLDWLLQQVPGSNLRIQARNLLDSLSDDTGANDGRSVFNQYNRKPTGSPATLADAYYLQVGQDGANNANLRSNYHALLDEFKQYSSLANPLRESRAFKPKLMSTARGFGKRAYLNDGPSQPQRMTYSDLLAAADQNGAISTSGKISGEASR